MERDKWWLWPQPRETTDVKICEDVVGLIEAANFEIRWIEKSGTSGTS